MSLVAPGPQAAEEKIGVDHEELLVKSAIDRATEECENDMPLMMQLCKISAEVDKAKKRAKTEKARKTKKEGQSADPRVPYDVLVQEGISPNPGPSATKIKKDAAPRYLSLSA